MDGAFFRGLGINEGNIHLIERSPQTGVLPVQGRESKAVQEKVEKRPGDENA
jgi:hypothetical protein